MAVEYAFDLYPALDPAGKISGTGGAARLARLTVGEQLGEADGDNYFLPVGHGVGWGRIRIHSDDPDIEFVEQRGYVNVRRIDVDEDLGGFFLEEGDFMALSEEEQGGRLLTFEGPSGLFILDRYSLGHSHYASGQPHRGDFDVVDYWTWANEPPGAILLRGILEGQEHPDEFFAAVDVDFTRTRDSNGLLWGDERELAEYATPIQTSILDLYEDMVLQGLVVQATGDLTIRAFRSINEFRTDRSSASFGVGKLRFERGENIAIEVPQKIHASVKRTHVLIRDRTGDYQTVDEDLDGNPLPGPPYMDTMRSDTTAADDTIIRMGQMRLTARQLLARQAVVRHAIGDNPTAGLYSPGPNGDYWVLDIGTVHTGTSEHDLNEADLEVAAIRISHDDAGNWYAEAQMGAQQISESAEAFQASPAGSRIGRVLRLCTPRQVQAQETVGGIGVAGNTLTLPDDLPDGAEVGDWIVGQVARDNGTGIPTIPAGMTAIGSGGGTSSGGGGSVAFRMFKRQLDAGDLSPGATYVFTGGSSIVGALLRTGGVDPQGAFAGEDIDGVGSGTAFTAPPLTLSDHSGRSRILVMGHHNQANVAAQSFTGLDFLATAPGPRGADAGVGEHAAWLGPLTASDYAGDSFTVSPSGGWQTHTIEVLGSEVVGIEGPQVDLAGVSEDAAHCDHAHHWLSVDEPTVDEDGAHGFPVGTRWLVVDTMPSPTDVVSRWDLIDNATGAAVWIEHTGGGGGAALDVQEGGVSVEDPVDEINFGSGFDVSSPGAGRVVVVLDFSEVTIPAAGVSIADAGGLITATQVEAALQEIFTVVAAHLVDTTDAHDASAISFDPTGLVHVTGSEVQTAIEELDAAIVAAAAAAALTVEEIDGTPTEVPVTLLQFPADTLTEPAAGQVRYKPVTSLTFGWDNGNAALTTAVNPIPIPIQANYVIEEWTALGIPVADGSASSCTVELWVDDYANYKPTVADKITASAPITFSTTDDKGTDSALTGWSTSALVAGKTLHVVPTAFGNLKSLTITLKLRRA